MRDLDHQDVALLRDGLRAVRARLLEAAKGAAPFLAGEHRALRQRIDDLDAALTTPRELLSTPAHAPKVEGPGKPVR